MNNLGLMLKKLRESKGFTIKELAEKAGISNGTVGDIESGRNGSTIKTIEKLAKALGLNKNERELLFSAFMPVDIGRKLSKKERVQFDDVINSASYFFNDESYDEQTKEKLLFSLQELFFDAKNKNKRKK
jgi:XRE family transcriptional regulator